ncbi:MAG: hypothetical protein GF344_00250 [Chitinivibrionales bacterium]|nr:hypothetical protein [Chitinivibrionales bacterium]
MNWTQELDWQNEGVVDSDFAYAVFPDIEGDTLGIKVHFPRIIHADSLRIEICCRNFVFAPRKIGLNYIALDGISMLHGAVARGRDGEGTPRGRGMVNTGFWI